MLENSFGLAFFLKSPRNESKIRTVYLRITIDDIPKETSTKRKWDSARWDQRIERAIGNKEDARSINFFLDSLLMKINEYKTEIIVGFEFESGNTTVFDLEGRLLQTFEVTSRTVPVDLASYPTGVYIVEIRTNNGTDSVKVLKGL